MALIPSDLQSCTLQQSCPGIWDLGSQAEVPLLSLYAPQPLHASAYMCIFLSLGCCHLCPLTASQKVPIISPLHLFFSSTGRWSQATLFLLLHVFACWHVFSIMPWKLSASNSQRVTWLCPFRAIKGNDCSEGRAIHLFPACIMVWWMKWKNFVWRRDVFQHILLPGGEI